MHAVVVRVTVHDREAAEAELRDRVIPQVSQAPGFVAGYWTRKDNTGISMIVFESEDGARAVAQMIESQGPPTDAAKLESVEVREVLANA